MKKIHNVPEGFKNINEQKAFWKGFLEGDSLPGLKKHDVLESLWEINTEDKAYLLGFLLADVEL